MRSWMLAAACVLGAACNAVQASGEQAGRFDYWMLALSWSPQYCSKHPSGHQCRDAHGFVVHGLWPEFANGDAPSYCRGGQAAPSAENVERWHAMLPDKRAIEGQWRKHGSCSGLAADVYVMDIERARRRIAIPDILQAPAEELELSRDALRQAFVQANPALDGRQMTLECDGRWLSEVRFCLDKQFAPGACGREVADDCGLSVHVRSVRGNRH